MTPAQKAYSGECAFCGVEMDRRNSCKETVVICRSCVKTVDFEEGTSPMEREESWWAPQDPGHHRTAKLGFYK